MDQKVDKRRTENKPIKSPMVNIGYQAGGQFIHETVFAMAEWVKASPHKLDIAWFRITCKASGEPFCGYLYLKFAGIQVSTKHMEIPLTTKRIPQTELKVNAIANLLDTDFNYSVYFKGLQDEINTYYNTNHETVTNLDVESLLPSYKDVYYKDPLWLSHTTVGLYRYIAELTKNFKPSISVTAERNRNQYYRYLETLTKPVLANLVSEMLDSDETGVAFRINFTPTYDKLRRMPAKDLRDIAMLIKFNLQDKLAYQRFLLPDYKY